MAQIPIARARRHALDRVVRVLREQFAARLALEADAAGLAVQPPPQPEHIFRVAPLDTEEALWNADVWVGVFNSTGSSPSARRGSAGPDGYCQFIETDVTCALVFREAIQELPALVNRPNGDEPGEIERRTLHAELMQLRADVYAGALLHTVMQYGQGGQAITDIDYVSDEGVLLLDGRQNVYGSATVVFNVTQKVLVPGKQPLPSDS